MYNNGLYIQKENINDISVEEVYEALLSVR
jgi:hypothetical protein